MSRKTMAVATALLSLSMTGCGAVVGAAIGTAISGSVAAAKLAAEASVMQVKATAAAVEGGVAVADKVGQVVHNQRLRNIELANASVAD